MQTRSNQKINLENISNASWKINLVLTMITSKSQKEYSNQDATFGSERVAEVADKGSSWRKIAMMLPEWEVRGGERKGLDNVFSVN